MFNLWYLGSAKIIYCFSSARGCIFYEAHQTVLFTNEIFKNAAGIIFDVKNKQNEMNIAVHITITELVQRLC